MLLPLADGYGVNDCRAEVRQRPSWEFDFFEYSATGDGHVQLRKKYWSGHAGDVPLDFGDRRAAYLAVDTSAVYLPDRCHAIRRLEWYW